MCEIVRAVGRGRGAVTRETRRAAMEAE